MFRTVPLPIIRSFSLYTQQWYTSYRFTDGLTLCDIYHLLCGQWKTPDDGQRNCPKHVEFYSKNKFDKLVHLVGLIIWIYDDARSHECQIRLSRNRILTQFISILKMEAPYPSETLGSTWNITPCHNPDDQNMNNLLLFVFKIQHVHNFSTKIVQFTLINALVKKKQTDK